MCAYVSNVQHSELYTDTTDIPFRILGVWRLDISRRYMNLYTPHRVVASLQQPLASICTNIARAAAVVIVLESHSQFVVNASSAGDLVNDATITNKSQGDLHDDARTFRLTLARLFRIR